MNERNRSDIKTGTQAHVVYKQNQRTAKLTEGIVLRNNTKRENITEFQEVEHIGFSRKRIGQAGRKDC